MEEAVTFRNRSGRALFGIIHEPSPRVARGLGIVMLNPGLKYRVAPNRLNVKLARELCRRGHTVLRFDPEGIGDSEGELPGGTPVADVWGMIQRGRFVADTRAAADFLLARCGSSRLALIGNCGGAITALLAGAEDARVAGLCLVDVPVYLWSSRKSFADTAVKGGERADRIFSGYLRQLLQLSSWRRFLTLQTDYGSLRKVVALKVLGAWQRLGRRVDARAFDEVIAKNNLNPQFFHSYDRCVARGVVIAFVSAGNDPGLETFTTFFVGRYLGSVRPGHTAPTTTVVDGANHVYSLAAWQQALFESVFAWGDQMAWAGQARQE